MKDAEIIEMAKQVTWRYPSPQNESLIAFARLIEKQVREDCAKEVDDFRKRKYNNECDISVAHDCAAAIRKGGAA